MNYYINTLQIDEHNADDENATKETQTSGLFLKLNDNKEEEIIGQVVIKKKDKIFFKDLDQFYSLNDLKNVFINDNDVLSYNEEEKKWVASDLNSLGRHNDEILFNYKGNLLSSKNLTWKDNVLRVNNGTIKNNDGIIISKEGIVYAKQIKFQLSEMKQLKMTDIRLDETQGILNFELNTYNKDTMYTFTICSNQVYKSSKIFIHYSGSVGLLYSFITDIEDGQFQVHLYNSFHTFNEIVKIIFFIN